MSECSYLLPVRRATFSESESTVLRDYLSILAEAGCEVIVIDGSPPEIEGGKVAAASLRK